MELDKVPLQLLNYLKKHYNNPKLEYKNPPTRFGQGITTYTYKLQLENAQPELSQPLVLRLFPANFPKLAFKEGTIQNALYEENYPVAKAHIICEDEKWLGGAFIVMDFLEGETMIESLPQEEVPEKLAETHVNLHTVNPATVIEKLKTSTINREWYDGTIFIDADAKKIELLKPALRWMKENEPSNRRKVLCHGDFHPLNILVKDGEVSGVLDWSTARIGEPERDVASTFCTLTIYGPMVIPDYDWGGLVEKHVEAYHRHSVLDVERLNYYKAVNSVAALEFFELDQLSQGLPIEVKERALLLFKKYSGISL